MSRQAQLNLKKVPPRVATPPSRPVETTSGSASGSEFKHPKGFPYQRSRITSNPESGDDESTPSECLRRTSTGKKPFGTLQPDFSSPPSSAGLYPNLIDTQAMLNDMSWVSYFGKLCWINLVKNILNYECQLFSCFYCFIIIAAV